MRSASPLAAIAATLLLHVAAVTAIVIGLTIHHEKPVEPLPVVVHLLPPPPPPPAPVISPPPTPPAPLPIAPPPPAPTPRPEAKREEPKPPAKPKPPPKPRMKPARQAKALAAPVEPTPAPSAPPSSAAAVPSVPAESSPAPAQAVAPAPPVPAPPAHPAPPAKTSVSIPATYAASNRKPEYPTMSRRYEEQGTVVLRVFVKEDGTAGDVEIKKSSGYPLLDKSAKSTVQTWRFNPATSNGKPVAEWYQLSIPFKLQD